MWLMWAKDNWKFLAGLGAVVIVFGFGYYKGYSHEHAKFQAHLNADATLVAVAKAENQRRVEEAEHTTQDIMKEHADAVAKIHDYYKSHPRIVRVCNNSSANSMSTKGKDSTGVIKTPDRVTEATPPSVEIDLLIAGEEIKQCQALIELETALDRIK